MTATDDVVSPSPLVTPRDTPALLASVVAHLLVLVVAAGISIPAARRVHDIIYASLSRDVPSLPPLDIHDLQVRELPDGDVGSEGLGVVATAASQAPQLNDLTTITLPELSVVDVSDLERDRIWTPPESHQRSDLRIKGSGGTAVSSARGAIDRITHEILLS
ncbi:MAG TPA: hypothetical protein VIY86_07535, partial [Pirellulaceae bacterium]